MNDTGFVGRSVEDVVSAVADRDDGRDPTTVRTALDPLTDDGVVTQAAVKTAVSDTSKLLATTETRVELAGIAHDAATDAAAPVDDLDVVAARIDEYTRRLDAVETRATALADDWRALDVAPADPDGVYQLAVGLRDVAATAQEVVREADDLSFDLEEFESWLDSSRRRYDEFEEDADHVAEALDELTAATEALPAESDAPAADWADATMRSRVLELLVTDLRTELTDLHTWADREETPFRAALDERVADLESRVGQLTDTLADRAAPAWRERFEADLAAFDRDLAAFEPPADWERVQHTLAERRERTFADR
jgi:chromosome segregation ATPase